MYKFYLQTLENRVEWRIYKRTEMVEKPKLALKPKMALKPKIT